MAMIGSFYLLMFDPRPQKGLSKNHLFTSHIHTKFVVNPSDLSKDTHQYVIIANVSLDPLTTHENPPSKNTNLGRTRFILNIYTIFDVNRSNLYKDIHH